MVTHGNIPARSFRAISERIREFAGLTFDATYLVPRWIVLRAVGAIFCLVFAGIITDAPALIGPRGLVPLAGFFTEWRKTHPGSFDAFWHAPSLFWLNAGPGTIAALAWGGLAAAVALLLNRWPRMALFVCWLFFLSFVTTWRGFSASQVDQLMLETALLCLPFAPAGFKPGLGATSPPRPITIFVMRWLLLRVMFESGLVKIFGGDPHWSNLTAMDVLYETTPFPTLFGYWLHQLPHAYHVGEIGLTFLAEIAAPLAAVFAGRRGRWFAFVAWTTFQIGIHLTNNFGWLNAASVGLGVLLLDDQMIASVAAKLGRTRFDGVLASLATPAGARPAASLPLRVALGTHFGLTLVFFALTCGMPVDGFPYALARPLKYLFWDFRSANAYTLYAGLLPARIGVEFEGSNDGGQTWRPFEFRYQPQREDQISSFLAPRYARFEATLQVEANRPEPSPLFGLVAAQLLARNAAVMDFFRRDPFPDRPPTAIRVAVYRFRFTDLATHRQTGRFWSKEFTGWYQPTMYGDAQGQIVEAVSAMDEVRLQAERGNPVAQNLLGVAYANGKGVEADATKAAIWYRKAAEQDLPDAQFNVGLLYAKGDGATRDGIEAVKWFRKAAEHGLVDAQAKLGFLYAYGEIVARDAREAAGWFQKAAAQGDAASQFFLGLCYANGDGVPQNYDEAAKFYRLAALQGNALAQANLGFLYSRGQGVAADEVEALAWFNVAAQSGNKDAIRILEIHASRAGAEAVRLARQRSEAIAKEIVPHRPGP